MTALLCSLSVVAGMISSPAQASPAGTDWVLQNTPGTDNSWTSITYGGEPGEEKFVAVGGQGKIMYSPNGLNWSVATAGVPANDFFSVTWGGPDGAKKFVAVSGGIESVGSRAIYSTDGVNWNTDVTGVSNDKRWSSVAAGGGKFVAVAFSSGASVNRVMTSNDGINWSEPSGGPGPLAWRSVTYGAGKFVAVASSGSGTIRATYSTDLGETWTQGSIDLGGSWASVVYGGQPTDQRFVAVGAHSALNSTRVMTSTNGINWTVDTSVTAGDWASVTWGGVGEDARFVAVGKGTDNRVMTSPTGLGAWTNQEIPVNNAYHAVAYGGSAFTAVSSDGGEKQAMRSTATSSVSYNGNGAQSGSVPSVSGTVFQQGEPVTVASNSGRLARAGYSFEAWNTKADGTGATYASGATFTMPGVPVALYAKWKKNSTPVTPGKPRQLKTTGTPFSPRRSITWKKPANASAATRYVVEFRVRGRSKVVLRKQTAKSRLVVTRKQLLRATYRMRGEYRGTLVYRVSVRAQNGSRQSAPATILLRVRG